MSKKVFLGIIILSSFINLTLAQEILLKNNLLYTGATLTPNLGLEFKINEKYSFDLLGSFNPWNINGKIENNKKIAHWTVLPEFRYWPKQNFKGHFVGVHGTFGMYNISQHNLDLIFGKDSNKFRFEGNAIGGGVTYGYKWTLNKKWALETDLGIGLLYLNYDKFYCQKCGKQVSSENKVYFGPTKAGINLSYTLK